MSGNPYISEDEKKEMNFFANTIISSGGISKYYHTNLYKLLKICNIIYNNAPNVMSPLNDDVYDRLVVLCRNQGVEYPIGSPAVQFNIEGDVDSGAVDIPDATTKREVMTIVDTTMPYFKDLTRNHLLFKEDYYIEDLSNEPKDFKKKRVATTENNLCGTLDKCKYVFNKDAQADGMFMDPTVSIFERDFLMRHVQMGVVNPNYVCLIATLKYDGISVECQIENGVVIGAFTRGDTNNDEATDLTPIFKGLRFPHCMYPNRCNVKFEVIITDKMLEYLKVSYDKHYANPRNAVIGLMGGLDARAFRDIVTLVPLESDIYFKPNVLNSRRTVEINFLNNHFRKMVDLRSVVIQGNVSEVLYKVKQYCESANRLRGYMGFWFDGIVIEYADDRIRQVLGKRKAIPNYSIAIKFPPLTAQSTFTHYTYSVGQTGIVTPKAHFLPVYFMGQKHDKASVHSLRKVNEFGLRAGDKVNLTFVNDVMVYLTPAPIEEQPADNPNPVEYFPERCPSCGNQLMMSESGDTAYCINVNCPERSIGRMTGFLERLNVSGFDKAAIRALQIHNVRDLLSITDEKARLVLGDVLGPKFIETIQAMLETEYPDYRLLHAIGFTGCGAEGWKKVFRHFRIESLLTATDHELGGLTNISGIGDKFVLTVITERRHLLDDIRIVLQRFKILKTPLNSYSRGGVRFSGVRDKQLEGLFNKAGYEADGNASVNKDTVILIVPMMGYESTNVTKAFKWQDKRLSLHGADMLLGRRIKGYGDQDLVDGIQIYPKIMTIEEAYKFIGVNN